MANDRITQLLDHAKAELDDIVEDIDDVENMVVIGGQRVAETEVDENTQPGEEDAPIDIPSLTSLVIDKDGKSHYKGEFKLAKLAQRRLDINICRKQVEEICLRITDGNRAKRGWTYTTKLLDPFYDPPTGGYIYGAMVYVECIAKREHLDKEFYFIVEDIIQKKVNNAAGGWRINTVNGEMFEQVLVKIEDSLEKGIFIPEDYMSYFEHIYERDAQIDILISAMNAALDSKFNNRFHTCLHGPPASGKTEILRAFKSLFNPEAVVEYDATSMTQAGAIKDLSQRAVAPRVLIVEEIEKTNEEALRWLLALLDHRAEIRKTNYRETVNKEIKLLCCVTVNDFDLFRKLMYGALASRFTNQLFCDRPSNKILKRILEREINRLSDGNPAWIKPALKFANICSITDPRKVTAICLQGKDQLLDGSYQAKLLECLTKADQELYAEKEREYNKKVALRARGKMKVTRKVE